MLLVTLICDTVLLTVVTMLYLTFLELNYFMSQIGTFVVCPHLAKVLFNEIKVIKVIIIQRLLSGHVFYFF